MCNKTRIYILRHGESLGNFNKECLGHTDKDLTEKGFRQAEATADALADISFDEIYSSDLIRAYHTALPHAIMRGLSVIKSDSFRELYFGEWEGMKVSDISDKYGDMFSVGWRQGFGTFTPPGGEYVQDCADRIVSSILDIVDGRVGKCILIASHAAAIRALWGRLLGLDPEDVCAAITFPENASFSILEYDGERLLPVSYSNSKHLLEID